MTTSGPKETTVKPEIPTLDLSEAQEVPRKKTLTEKVKSLKETVKRAVTPRSRSASMNEEELAAAAKKVKVTESDQKGQATRRPGGRGREADLRSDGEESDHGREEDAGH